MKLPEPPLSKHVTRQPINKTNRARLETIQTCRKQKVGHQMRVGSPPALE